MARIARVSDWKGFLCAKAPAEDIRHLRRHERTGRPLGTEPPITNVERAPPNPPTRKPRTQAEWEFLKESGVHRIKYGVPGISGSSHRVLGASGQICPRRSGPNQVLGALDALDSDDIGESFIDPSCVSSQSGRAIHAAANSQVFTATESLGRSTSDRYVALEQGAPAPSPAQRPAAQQAARPAPQTAQTRPASAPWRRTP